MISAAQRTKLVVFLLTTLSIGVVLLVFFTRHQLFRSTARYYVRVPGSVTGIDRGSTVALRGVKVGKVDKIELFADDFESVRLVLAIDRDVPIAKDAQATLTFQGVTGLKFVDISGGSAEHGRLTPEHYIPYETPGLERVTDHAADLVARADKLLMSTNTLVEQLTRLATRVDAARVDEMLGSTQEALVAFKGAGNELHGLVKELHAPMQRTLGSAEAAFQGARHVTNEAGTTMSNLNGAVTELRQVVRQNETNLRVTAYNLREATQSFRQLADELRRRPSRLLISEAPPERSLP